MTNLSSKKKTFALGKGFVFFYFPEKLTRATPSILFKRSGIFYFRRSFLTALAKIMDIFIFFF